MTSNSNADATAVVDLAAERAARLATVGTSDPSADVIEGHLIDRPADTHDATADVYDEDDDEPRPVDGLVVEHHGRAMRHGSVPGAGFAAGVRDAVTRRALPDRAVVPAWMRDRESATSAAVWAGRYAAHAAGFHAVRLPVYWARLAARSPVGAYRLGAATFRWVFDADSRQVRRAFSAAAGGAGYGTQDAAAWARLDDQRKQTTRTRLWVVTGVLSALFIAAWVLLASQPGWVAVLTAAVLLAVLGAFGRDASTRVVSRYTSTSEAPKFTPDLLLTALGALGLSELNKGLKPGAGGVTFASDIARDGAGFRADVDLPPGVTAGMIVDRRDRLAAGLRRPLSAVWPTGDSDIHEGRLVLWVGDKPMNKAKPVVWPLAAKGTVDLFAPFPIGVDPRGRVVTVTIMFASVVIGGQPRMGKSFFARLLLLAAALDPRAELHIYDLKGSPDQSPLEQVAHVFRSGDDEDDIAHLLTDVTALQKEISRRNKVLKSLPRDICPEGKITPELASRKDLGLHPIVLFIDECQVAFEHPTYGEKQLKPIIVDLTKRGPSVGVIVMPATQRPDDKSLPKGISDNAILRICLRVGSHTANDMVLGSSAYKSGHRATMFSRKEQGVAYLVGEGDDPQIVRGAYVDAVAAEKITARARAARIAAGRLTGYAAGVDLDPDTDHASILDRLATVWPPTEDRAWCDTLAARLAEAFPALYGGWTGSQITDAVKPHGLTVRQIKIDGQNRRGLRRDDLAAALANRDDDTAREVPGEAPTDGSGEAFGR